jgi:hypothetical protein
MKKHFYDDIADIDSVYLALDKMGLAPSQREELALLVDAQVHHTILDLILSQLSEEDKKKFMTYHASQKHDEVWTLLNSRIENVEDKIKQTVRDVKKKLHEDIDKST